MLPLAAMTISLAEMFKVYFKAAAVMQRVQRGFKKSNLYMRPVQNHQQNFD